MDKKAFDSLFNNDEILKTPNGSIQEQILSSANCFNPLIVITRAKNPTIIISPEEENQQYFESLTQVRQAIEKKDFIAIINTLGNFHRHCFAVRDRFAFAEFMMFEGLFYGCKWFKNTSATDYPQDLICQEKLIPEGMNFEAFLNDNESPKNRLEVLFEGMQDMETDKIGSVGYEKNPIGLILQGNLNREGTAFHEAKVCLTSNSFLEAWELLKKTRERNRETNTNLDNVENGEISKIVSIFPMTDKQIIKKLEERYKGKKLTEPLMRELEEITKGAQWTDEEKAGIFGKSRVWYTKKRTKWLGKKRSI